MHYEVTLEMLWRAPDPERAEDDAQPLLTDAASSYGYTITGFGAKEADPDLVYQFVEEDSKAEQPHQLVRLTVLVKAASEADAEDELQGLMTDAASSYGYTITGFGAKAADADTVATFAADTEEED